MRNPDRLEVLERANELVVLVYLATDALPPSERFGLVSQLQRAAGSIGANIAEGCGRSTEPAFLGYLQNAMGSATEVENHLVQSLRLRLGDSSANGAALAMTRRVKMMLARLQQAVRRRTGEAKPAPRTRKGRQSRPPG